MIPNKLINKLILVFMYVYRRGGGGGLKLPFLVKQASNIPKQNWYRLATLSRVALLFLNFSMIIYCA